MNIQRLYGELYKKPDQDSIKNSIHIFTGNMLDFIGFDDFAGPKIKINSTPPSLCFLQDVASWVQLESI